jgi:hypothetical protein
MNEGMACSAIPLGAFEYTNWCILSSYLRIPEHLYVLIVLAPRKNTQKEVCRNS